MTGQPHLFAIMIATFGGLFSSLAVLGALGFGPVGQSGAVAIGAVVMLTLYGEFKNRAS